MSIRKLLSALLCLVVVAVTPAGAWIRHGAVTYTVISPPSGYGATPPFNVLRGSDGSITTDYVAANFKPSYTRTIYVDPVSGSNSNNCTAAITPCAGLSTAITKANAFTGENVRILRKPGRYLKSAGNSLNGTNPTVPAIIFEIDGDGYAYNIEDVALPAFVATANPAVWVSTYVSQSPSRSMLDMTYISHGFATPTTVVATVADPNNPIPELVAQAAVYGSASYLNTSTKKFWVILWDGRQPDSNTYVATSGGARLTAASTSPTLWQEYGAFFGGSPPVLITSGATGAPSVYSTHCAVLGNGSGDAYGWLSGGGLSILSDSYVRNAYTDNVSYHGGVTSGFGIEINVYSELAGWDGGGANNTATSHEGWHSLRIGGTYTLAADRVVHDINDTKNWILYSSIGYSRRGMDATQNSASLAVGGSGSGSPSTWIDTVTIVAGSQYDIEVGTSSTLYYANMGLAGLSVLLTGTGAVFSYAS